MDSGILSTQLENLPASGLAIELNRVPPFFIGIYLLFFLLVVIACYLSISTFSFFLCSTFAIAAYGQLLFRKSLLRSHPSALKNLVFTELGWCFIRLNNGRIIKADIDVDTILTEHLIILNLNEHLVDSLWSHFLKHHCVLLTANELGSDKFRQIKRHLRLINFSKKNEP
jgi:hypothetical protein